MYSQHFTLNYHHEVQISFTDPVVGWEAVIQPIVGGIGLNVDFDDKTGFFIFEVMHCETGYADVRRSINRWIVEGCDKFILNGTTYTSINELSLAMWIHELRTCANDPIATDDILECVGGFANAIQMELYRNG